MVESTVDVYFSLFFVGCFEKMGGETRCCGVDGRRILVLAVGQQKSRNADQKDFPPPKK